MLQNVFCAIRIHHKKNKPTPLYTKTRCITIREKEQMKMIDEAENLFLVLFSNRLVRKDVK